MFTLIFIDLILIKDLWKRSLPECRAGHFRALLEGEQGLCWASPRPPHPSPAPNSVQPLTRPEPLSARPLGLFPPALSLPGCRQQSSGQHRRCARTLCACPLLLCRVPGPGGLRPPQEELWGESAPCGSRCTDSPGK